MDKPPLRDPGRSRPQFTFRTVVAVYLFVATFAALGLSFELLIGIAWLILAPVFMLILIALQYPLMARLSPCEVEENRQHFSQTPSRSEKRPAGRTVQVDLKETDEPSS